MTVPKMKRNVSGKGRKGVKDNGIKTRKEIRKDKRKEKRMRKHEFFSRKKDSCQKIIKQVTGKSIDVSRESHKTHLSDNAPIGERKTSDGFIKHQLQEKEKERMRKQKLENEMKKTRQKQLKQANQEEDKVIKKLEKQLKLNKRKSKSVPKSFTSDGLDYLLEVCDEDKIKQAVLMEQNLHESGSEFEEDFAMVTGKAKKLRTSESNKRKDEDNENESSEVSDDEDLLSNPDEVDSDGSLDDHQDNDDDLVSNHSEVSASSLLEQEVRSSHEDDHSGMQRKRRTKESNIKVTNSERVVMKRRRVDSNDSDIDEDRSPSLVGESKNKKNKKKIGTLKEGKSASGDSEEIASEGGLYVRLRPGPENTSEKKKSKAKQRNFSEPDDDALSEVSDPLLSGSGDSEEETDGERNKAANDEYWEDIYGRTRDKKGNVVQLSAGKYVPPQLRAQASSGDAKKKEQLLRLRKQMKGLLNRLAENNMNSIATQLDELYMSHSRNDMNDTLTTLMLESLVSPVITPERLIMEHCMLITVLHANVGTEVGAHFLQVIIKRFSELHNEECEVENKELDNIILIISHLYNFKVFHSLLMYNILDKLAEAFGPKEVELILLVLRSVGFSLRKDDPISLKALVLQLQQKASKASQSQTDSRVQFMLDILLAIKNNNMAKIPNYDPTHSEHLKKLLKGFLRKGNYVTELKISLEDLLKAEERGRWWVVGSAWSGVLPGESQSEDKAAAQARVLSQDQNYSQQLLDLARKQRMNTDVRRNIFCILMTAEDFLDAFEKLLHLGLKNQQEREIIHVTLDCCLHEKEFNPYYGHVTRKFCEFDRKYQMILQYALWDKFKEVQNMRAVEIGNLARLLVLLLTEEALPISVLKVIHFAEVDKATVRLLRQILLGVLLHSSQDTMQEVFRRVAVAPKLHMFRESIRLFIQHFLLRKTDSLPQDDVETLKERANMADTILSMADSRSRLL